MDSRRIDLIEKIRELAVWGDASAKALEHRYETYVSQIHQGNSQGIKNASEFERTIIEICRDDLHFFDAHQYVDLVRLREDRHRCAHPSFQRVGIPYDPSAEHARMHIRNAVIHVLAQPPVQGKAALTELKTLVSSAYFPVDGQKAIAQLENSGLKNATEALVRGFVDQLIFGFLDDRDSLFYKHQTIAAINAAYELYPTIVEDRLRKDLNEAIRDIPDNRFPGACCLVARVTSAWGVLEQTSKDKVARFVEGGPASEVLNGLAVLSKLDGLKQTAGRRVNSLDFDELAEAITLHGLKSIAKERALYFLSQAGTWNLANEVFQKLVFPVLDSLLPTDVERIIRMHTDTGADLPGAHGFTLFIEKVRQTGILDGPALNKLLAEHGASYLVSQDEIA